MTASNRHTHRTIHLSPTCSVEVEVVFDKPTCFWSPPEIRQSWKEKGAMGEEELKATWDELFFDLVIVASIGQVGAVLRWNEESEHRRLSTETKSDMLIHFALLFTSIYQVWMQSTQFNARVKATSLSHTLRLLLKMVAIAGMGANHDRTAQSMGTFFAFAAMAWMMETAAVAEVVYVCNVDPRFQQYRRTTTLHCTILLIPVLAYSCMAAAALFWGADEGDLWVAWILFACTGITQSPTLWHIFLGKAGTVMRVLEPFNKVEQSIPMNVLYITERFGLFQIIVLGETVIAGSAGFEDFFNAPTSQKSAAVASLFLAVMTKLLYYELQSEQKRHALRISKIRGFGFFASHTFIYLLLVAMGSLLHDVSAGSEWDGTQRAVFSVASGGFLWAVAILTCCHEGVGRGLRQMKKEARVGTRSAIGLVLVVAGAMDGFGLGGFTDLEIIGFTILSYTVDFFVEFEGSKFSKEKCGCVDGADAPCLQRIISEQIAISRPHTLEIQGGIEEGREESVDSLDRGSYASA